MINLKISWHYYQQGSPDGIPILFVHGFMGKGKIWQPVINNLSDRLYSTAVDLPGHGKTMADLRSLDFEVLSDALIAFLDDLGLSNPVMVGYSLGGRISLYTALKYPDKFRALVIESASPGIEDAVEREQRLNHDREIAEKLRHSSDLRLFMEAWYRQPVFRNLDNDLKQRIIAKKSGNDPELLAEVVEKLSQGRQPSLWTKLCNWTKPALIVAGEFDRKYVEISRSMASILPAAELKIIKNAGHIVHLENKKDFATALNSFLDSYIL